ncbi:MAG: hypothetical protein IKA87_06080, partial [Lentisphaeria bacterium]|nr:hypothetical protein [Lentisphaeria bacterium]
KDIKNTILQKLKEGTGLVYTGASYGPDLWRSGKRHGRTNSSLHAVGSSMLNSGIPFELFPPVYLHRQPVKTGSVIHAADKSNVPYLMSTLHGKGRAVGFFFSPPTHYTGMIPYDPWEPYYVYDTPTPVELYFSMLAKAMFYAAGRKYDVEFASFDRNTLSWQVKAPAGKTVWEFRIYDRNNELRDSGKKELLLKKGLNTVKVPFQVKPFNGPQYVSVTVRNSKGEVLNWGSWSFERKPEFKITKVKCTPEFIKDGEQVEFNIECTPTGKRNAN